MKLTVGILSLGAFSLALAAPVVERCQFPGSVSNGSSKSLSIRYDDASGVTHTATLGPGASSTQYTCDADFVSPAGGFSLTVVKSGGDTPGTSSGTVKIGAYALSCGNSGTGVSCTGRYTGNEA